MENKAEYITAEAKPTWYTCRLHGTFDATVKFYTGNVQEDRYYCFKCYEEMVAAHCQRVYPVEEKGEGELAGKG